MLHLHRTALLPLLLTPTCCAAPSSEPQAGETLESAPSSGRGGQEKKEAAYESIELTFDEIDSSSYEGQYAAYFDLEKKPDARAKILEVFCPQDKCLAIHDPDSNRAYSADFSLAFVRPVRNVRLRVGGSNDRGAVARLSGYRSDGSFAGTVDVLGSGNHNMEIAVDLSLLGELSRVSISDVTDYRGLTWDTFAFEMRKEE